MESIVMAGKDPTLPSSYRPISLPEIVGKLFEKNLSVGPLQKKYMSQSSV
jgi:hypothetical protein